MEEAFENVDQIVEGKWLEILSRILAQFSSEETWRACNFLSEGPASRVLALCLLPDCVCVALGGAGKGATESIEEKFLRLGAVKDRGKNSSKHFQLVIQSYSLWNRWSPSSQDNCLSHPFPGQDTSSWPVPRLACFWISNQHTPPGISLCLHFTGEVHVGGQEHFYMETQRVLVIPKTEDKELDIYVSTQDPAHVQVRSRIPPPPKS